MSKRPVGDDSGTSSEIPDSKRVKTVDDQMSLGNDNEPSLNSVTPAVPELSQSTIESEVPTSSIAESSSTLAISSSAKPTREKRKAKQNASKNSVKLDRRGKRAVQQERVPWNTPRQSEGADEEKKERLAKRKCAVLIGFCGSGYQGMQVYVKKTTLQCIKCTFDENISVRLRRRIARPLRVISLTHL